MQIFPHFCYEKMVIKSSDVQELNAATSSFNYDLVLICPKCCYCHLDR